MNTIRIMGNNPIGGIKPNFTIFGVQFTHWWQTLLAGLWAGCILIAIGFLMVSLLQMRRATANNVPGQADEAKSSVLHAALTLGGLVGFGVIVGAIFAIFG